MIVGLLTETITNSLNCVLSIPLKLQENRNATLERVVSSTKSMDEEVLVAAVRRLKVDQVASTAKEVHQALLAEGAVVEFSQVKKACSKVTKARAQEPASGSAAPPGLAAETQTQADIEARGLDSRPSQPAPQDASKILATLSRTYAARGWQPPEAAQRDGGLWFLRPEAIKRQYMFRSWGGKAYGASWFDEHYVSPPDGAVNVRVRVSVRVRVRVRRAIRVGGGQRGEG